MTGKLGLLNIFKHSISKIHCYCAFVFYTTFFQNL